MRLCCFGLLLLTFFLILPSLKIYHLHFVRRNAVHLYVRNNKFLSLQCILQIAINLINQINIVGQFSER